MVGIPTLDGDSLFLQGQHMVWSAIGGRTACYCTCVSGVRSFSVTYRGDVLSKRNTAGAQCHTEGNKM